MTEQQQQTNVVDFVFHISPQKELQVMIPAGGGDPYMRVLRRAIGDNSRDCWMNLSQKGMKRLDDIMPLIKEDLEIKRVNIFHELTALISIGVIEFNGLLYVGFHYEHGNFKNFINFTPKDFDLMQENWAKIMAWFPVDAVKVSMVKSGLPLAEELLELKVGQKIRYAPGFGPGPIYEKVVTEEMVAEREKAKREEAKRKLQIREKSTDKPDGGAKVKGEISTGFTFGESKPRRSIHEAVKTCSYGDFEWSDTSGKTHVGRIAPFVGTGIKNEAPQNAAATVPFDMSVQKPAQLASDSIGVVDDLKPVEDFLDSILKDVKQDTFSSKFERYSMASVKEKFFTKQHAEDYKADNKRFKNRRIQMKVEAVSKKEMLLHLTAFEMGKKMESANTCNGCIAGLPSQLDHECLTDEMYKRNVFNSVKGLVTQSEIQQDLFLILCFLNHSPIDDFDGATVTDDEVFEVISEGIPLDYLKLFEEAVVLK